MKIEFNGSIEEYKKFLNTEIERINKKVNNQEYIDLGLPSGTLWAKCNVGASSEEEYGDYLNYDDANNKYYLPSTKQFEELENECQWKWCTVKGHNGYLIIGRNGNSIFLPAAGYQYYCPTAEADIYGYYWSLSLSKTCSYRAMYLCFDSSHNIYSSGRHGRQSVRPVK